MVTFLQMKSLAHDIGNRTWSDKTASQSCRACFKAAGVLLVFSVITLGPILEAQSFEWAQSAGGSGSDVGQGIAVDKSGNTYVTGFFQGTVTFGPFTLNSAGGFDVFVVKYDNFGSVIWARSAGGQGHDIGSGIAVDITGNCYVAGYFTDTATFGSYVLTNAGARDVFVAKYDSSGNVVWAKSAGGITTASGEGIAVDVSGNSYVTGFYAGTAMFGSFSLTSAGELDAFVAKFDNGGDVAWARSAGGIGADIGYDIAVDAEGNSFITGVFWETAIFDSFTLTSVGGSADIFVAKYDSSGNVQWTQSAGGSGYDQGFGICVDDSGNCFVTGEFRGSAMFGSHELTSVGFEDVFVVKYDPKGNVLWARSAGGISVDNGYGIAVDDLGNAYATGSFIGTVSFGPHSLSSAGGTDVFVAMYDSIGNVQWARSAGGTWQDRGASISVDGAGNNYITGNFRLTAMFGPIVLESVGNNDVFVAKLAPPPTPIPTIGEWGIVILVLFTTTIGTIVFGVVRRRTESTPL